MLRYDFMVTDPLPPHDGGCVINNGTFRSAGAYGHNRVHPAPGTVGGYRHFH